MEAKSKSQIVNEFLSTTGLQGADLAIQGRLTRSIAVKNELIARLKALGDERAKLEAGLISANSHIEALADLVAELHAEPKPNSTEDSEKK